MTKKETESLKIQSNHAVPSPSPNRTYKSRLFEMIFREKPELLELYNAVSGTHYEDPELLTINTLENAIYMAMHNDISFLIDSRLELYEHQSSYCPNMPLRDLFYISELYSGITKNDNIYGEKKLSIPTPHFIVFYNGIDKRPDREELKLSDLFIIKETEKSLELTVIVLNINIGHNQELLDACPTLKEYSEYVRRVREYSASIALEDAVEKAITEFNNFILKC